MRIQNVTIRHYKRFTDLTVQGIPNTARLIMLAGPNGCGKSSFFDALYKWHTWRSLKDGTWDADYHVKTGTPQRNYWQDVTVTFFDSVPDNSKKAFYVRSAYRNDPAFRINSIGRQGDPYKLTVARMIDNDAAVSRNYQRLVSRGMEDLYGSRKGTEGQMTLDQYVKSSIGAIRTPLTRLFPDLELDNLGSPMENGTFYFTKGVSRGFAYQNLSGGEKASFDLILDLVIARHHYDNTLYCIDEPEAHMHARLQAELLSVIYELIPQNCQLMLATHSVGMMRRARDIGITDPGSVVFLDFGDRDFDEPQVIEPTKPSRVFWKRAYEIALDDLATLVAPSQVVICEGEPITPRPVRNHSLDARCYERIFEQEFPETEFISMGNDKQIIEDQRGLQEALVKLIRGMKIVRLIDRDDRTEAEIKEAWQQGIRVLTRRNLESYLFDDEVLTALAAEHGRQEEIAELLTEKQAILANNTTKADDNLKPVSGQIYNACKSILNLTQCGNTTKAFMRDTLAPLIKPGMKVYRELKQDIFGPMSGS